MTSEDLSWRTAFRPAAASLSIALGSACLGYVARSSVYIARPAMAITVLAIGALMGVASCYKNVLESKGRTGTAKEFRAEVKEEMIGGAMVLGTLVVVGGLLGHVFLKKGF